ncbi:MAG TPA: DMT family transporter [Actinomycetota bacterium]|nr:DMT family transporter [Actinomycetota bacterium]
MLLPTAALVAACALWGSTFVVVKQAVEQIPPVQFLAIRFAIGTGVLALLWRPRVRGSVRPGALAGLALGAGYIFQTVGLQHTTATNAALVTGLFVVFTPALAALFLRRPPTAPALVGVALATTGLVLLSLQTAPGLPAFRRGDAIVLGCAVMFALHVVALGRFAPGADVRALTVVQLAVCTVLFVVLLPTARVEGVSGGQIWFALLLTGLGATAFAFAAQTWAQSRISPTRTAVILTMEPVFAALFGFAVLGDRLTARGWIGAAFILAGMVAAELRVSASPGAGTRPP